MFAVIPAVFNCRHIAFTLMLEQMSTNGPAGEPAVRAAATSTQSSDDYCPICYVDALGAAPAIALTCGHIVHAACAKVHIPLINLVDVYPIYCSIVYYL